MIPPFSFAEIVLEERERSDPETMALAADDIKDALTREQSQGLRISDAGSCSLALWAKVNGELTIARDPMTSLSRLDAGSIFGAYLGRLYKAGCARRGVLVLLEEEVECDGIPGHIDIRLPEYKHIYDVKSNYDNKKYDRKQGHAQQIGMYADSYDDDYTASIALFRLATPTRAFRLTEYEIDQENLIADAKAESFRLRRAAGAVIPPEPDIASAWVCKSSCQYGSCSRNTNQ